MRQTPTLALTYSFFPSLPRVDQGWLQLKLEIKLETDIVGQEQVSKCCLTSESREYSTGPFQEETGYGWQLPILAP